MNTGRLSLLVVDNADALKNKIFIFIEEIGNKISESETTFQYKY